MIRRDLRRPGKRLEQDAIDWWMKIATEGGIPTITQNDCRFQVNGDELGRPTIGDLLGVFLEAPFQTLADARAPFAVERVEFDSRDALSPGVRSNLSNIGCSERFSQDTDGREAALRRPCSSPNGKPVSVFRKVVTHLFSVAQVHLSYLPCQTHTGLLDLSGPT
jgi:hypothetical protein